MGRPSVASLPFPFSSKRREGRQGGPWGESSSGLSSQDSVSPDRALFSQTGLCFSKQDSVFPDRTLFSQTGLCFSRQDSVFPDRTLFFQTGLCFSKQDSVFPDRTLFFQTGLRRLNTVIRSLEATRIRRPCGGWGLGRFDFLVGLPV